MDNAAREEITQIGIIGAGSWGTALAILTARNGIQTHLLGKNAETITQMIQQRRNQHYLPDIRIPDNLLPTQHIQDLSACDIIMLVVPSHAFHDVLIDVKKHLPNVRRLVWATKGFEDKSNRLLHHVVEDLFDNIEYAVLSGPTFALEVAQGLPTAVTIASHSHQFAGLLAKLSHNKNFRAYTSSDIIGVEIGGAVKNVLAIAAGISDGLGFGANTRAALVTRGLAEIIRLGSAMGAVKETFMGLAGLGDLILTCTDNLSRNRRFGLAIAKGISHAQAKEEIGQVVEGIKTAKAVFEMSKALKIDMPITEKVYQVLYENRDPESAVQTLFLRDIKEETD